jgi:hypothetical protein
LSHDTRHLVAPARSREERAFPPTAEPSWPRTDTFPVLIWINLLGSWICKNDEPKPARYCNGEVWVKTTLDHADPPAHWRQRLADGLAHDLGLVIAKAVHGQLAADVPQADIVRQVALFGAQSRDGWCVGLTILIALVNLLPMLPEEEGYLALFHGARRVAVDCEGEAPRWERAPLGSRPDPAALKRWLRRWTTRLFDIIDFFETNKCAG